LKSEIKKNVIEILGHSCDELVLTCKSGVQRYYFSDKLKLDANLYKKHLFMNWGEVIYRTNAIPLKMIIDNAQFYLESTATGIEAKDLDGKLFELPPDAKIEKSPF
jgi:hypothetical protein